MPFSIVRLFTALVVAAGLLGCSLADVRAADPAPLPRVLILGDSISIGYTPIVRKNLEGKAEVVRPNTNCQHTAHGLSQIKQWLGDGKWDVIHFNWGIWDTHMLDEQGKLIRDEAGAMTPLHVRHTPEQYRANLTSLVETMQATGAKLIWAETTPILRYKGDRLQAVPKLNSVAAEIMKSRGIAVNDLYEFVLPHAAEWQSADKVHFNAAGNQELGRRVSDRILEVLEKKGR